MTRTFLPHVITDDSALGGAVIERSLRFRAGSSPKLTRTFGNHTSGTTKTISFWMKRGSLGATEGMQNIFCTALSGYIEGRLRINSDDTLQFEDRDSSGGTSDGRRQTTAKLRDVTAWYHIILALDSTQGTEADRAKIYINGTQAAISADRTITHNYTFSFMRQNAENYIGEGTNEGSHLDAYLAEVNFIDGQQLDPSYFGFTDSQTGMWMPKRYEGTYGNNGFHLEFKDNSSTSTLGKDTSGNQNDFASSGMSVDLGTSDDSMIDTPTNNFPTLNPSNRSSGPTLSFANLYFFYNYKPASKTCRTTFRLPKSGKYYWEWENNEASSNPGRWQAGLMNVVNEDSQNGTNYDITGYNDADIVSYSYGGSIWFGTTHTSGSWDGTTRSWFRPQRCAWAVDCDTGNVWLGRVADDATTQWWASNGSATGNPSKLLNPTGQIDKDKTHEHLPFISFHEGGSANSTGFAIDVNFGQHAFKGTVPDGFKTLSTANIPPDPTINTIVRPQRHFDTILYTGDGQSNRKITGLEFKPGLVWLKQRAASGGGEIGEDHGWYDSVRGVTKRLKSNSSAAEDTSAIGSFDDGGFTFATETYYNDNNDTFVGWFWKAGDATVTNNDGSITSSVSANTEAGFSIVSFTGNATSGATVGHGLNSKPKWFIIKERGNTNDWVVYHESLGSSSGNTNVQFLNLTNDIGGGFAGGYNNTAPTSSVFSLGNSTETNRSGGSFIAYCWSEIPGFSKFGSYIGNGSTDGRFVYIGFRPAWLLVKRTDSAENWVLKDSVRSTYNPVFSNLNTNTTNAEFGSAGDVNSFDFVSNGFKIRGTNSAVNASGGTFIYMAFAEQPGVTPFDTFSNAR